MQLNTATVDAGVSRAAMEEAAPREIREHIRAGRWRGPTKKLAVGYHQANLVIVRQQHAFDFMRFCLRNRQAFPLFEVLDPGVPTPHRLAADADIRTDLGNYSVYREGVFAGRVEHLMDLWRDDHVAFLLGCAISLERPLLEAGIRLPPLPGDDVPSPMYITKRECVPAGVFSGPLVVGLRLVPDEYVVPMTAVTSRHEQCHGAPVHIGDPSALVADFGNPDWGTPREVPPGYTPMFWACGLTAQAAAMRTRIPEMITQSVGRMFVTDLPVLAAL